MNRFTDKWIKNIRPIGKKQEFNSGDGFLLRVGVSGSKTFYFRYKLDGKKRFMKLGTYPNCTLEQAKKKHLEAWTAFKNGESPEQTNISNIGELVEDWYERYILVNRKKPGQIRQQIDADIIPLLGNLKLDKITTRKLTLALEKIVDRGSPVHANKVLSSLKQAFNYAIGKGVYTSVNPLQNTKAADVGGREEPRDRNLSMEELKTVWIYLDSDRHHFSSQTVIAIKLIILAGSRLSEIRDAFWTEFDFKNKLWKIPKKRYKTGIEHKVHLTEQMIKLLMDLKKLSGDSDKLFPGMGEKSLGDSIRRSQERIGIEKWTLHDIRRTFATRMADVLDIDIVVIEKLLGHKLPKIMATYQKDEMLNKRKKALEAWSSKIEMLVTNDNVVMLKTA